MLPVPQDASPRRRILPELRDSIQYWESLGTGWTRRCSEVTIGAMAHKFRSEQPKDPRPRAVLPDPFYYLSNFETVLASLNERYAHLWTAEETQFLATFPALPKVSRALLVRMVMREGVSFRASRLNYPEIGETAAAIASLIRVGWVDDGPKLEVGDLQKLITKEELLHYFPWSRPYGNLTKPDLVAVLREQYPEARSFQAWCKGSSDQVYQLLVAPICERMRLMFFGNYRQDWREFVLRDLGVFVYEKVPLHSRPFVTRTQVDVFEQLHLCGQWLDTGVALDQVMAAVPAPITDSDWLEQHRQKLIFQVGHAAERAGDPKAALEVYATCTYRNAHLRRIRILERAQEREIARDLCLAALRTSESEAETEQLARLLPRLNRKLGIAVTLSRRAPKIPAFDIVLAPPARDDPVEYCALDHLKQAAGGHSSVHYVENGLVKSLFGLLCWRAIFAPIPGAFFHEFQYGPSDLSSGYFYERRRQEFAECFAELESEEYKATIRRFLSDKAGIQSPFVVWRLLSKSLLESALTCFPATHLRLWFEWIVRDTENRAGFPDLVQFWPRERRYRMIEVKGPGDRLQDNQRRWMQFCLQQEIPVSVCHVRWA
jgi:VRR-NUC domain/Fanconi anemia-associated nuclease SAP domain